MSGFEKYYDEELRYLREAGKEFAEAFPDRARYLNLEAVEDRDPYVERLFEGFAFISGRIRQKLEDDFPEFTQNLLDMVAPGFLQGIPSFTLVQFAPKSTLLPHAVSFPKGTLLLSQGLGPEKRICRFRTTQEVTLQPLVLLHFTPVHHPVHGDGFRFDFQVEAAADLNGLSLPSLPLYLHGEKPLACFLHLFLTSKVSRVFFEAGPPGNGRLQDLGGQENALPGGFGEGEGLLPAPDHSFEGSRFLHEFFAFEEKFRFVNLVGIPSLSRLDDSRRFSLHYHFSEPLPQGKRVKPENFKLHVSPAVNLFETETEPVDLNHRHFEYRLLADPLSRQEIHSVTSVTGVEKKTARRRPYLRFSDFRHEVLAGKDEARRAYYSVRQETRPGKGVSTYLSVGSHGDLDSRQEEYLSVTALATDGAFPRESLPEGALNSPPADFAGGCVFSNFIRPTAPVAPPKADHYLWYVLSHLNMNLRSLAGPGMLGEVLALYDWAHTPQTRKMVEGVQEVRVEKRDHLLGTQLVRGSEVTVQMRDDSFSEEGERVLFARVLAEFLSQYASLNHLLTLRLVLSPSGKATVLTPKAGRCHSI